MGFFKRKDNVPLIPPVAPTPGQQARAADPYANRGAGAGAGRPGGRDPYAAGGSDPYAQRGGGDPYASKGGNPFNRGQTPNNPPPPYGAKSQYSNASPYGAAGSGQPYGGQPYGGQQDTDAARAELFGGMTQAPPPVRARQYGYDGRENEEDFDEDEEIEGIKQGMRETKMDSLASTRNALRLAREAEDTARGTIGRLADQSDSLANTERHLDMAKANSQRAEDKAQELKTLNRSIFRPAIVWNKEGKRQAQEQKIMNRHNMEREDRMKTLNDVHDSRRRLGNAAETRSGTQIQAGKLKQRAEQRKRFQFDATASDDELEDELDENLDETLEITRRLKTLAGAMGDEVTKQNQRIGVITDKTDKLSYQVTANTERLKMIK